MNIELNTRTAQNCGSSKFEHWVHKNPCEERSWTFAESIWKKVDPWILRVEKYKVFGLAERKLASALDLVGVGGDSDFDKCARTLAVYIIGVSQL